MHGNNYPTTTAYIVFLGVFLLALNQVMDTDAWMHLNLGRLIWENLLEHGGFPHYEQYIYTAQDTAFLYTSWLFAVAYYLAHNLFDIYGVILLKATIIATTFLVLYRDATKNNANVLITVLVILVFAVLCRSRFVERPDTVMFLMLATSIYLVNQYVRYNSKAVYFLPLIHLLWANLQSSVILMLAPYLAVIGGGLIQIWLANRKIKFANTPDYKQLGVLALLLLASLMVVAINPNGYTQLFFGLSILETEYFKEEIIELAAPTAKLFTITLLTIITLIALKSWHGYKQAKHRDYTQLPKLTELALIVPFVVLFFTSVRFIYPLLIVLTPIFARYLSDITRHIQLGKNIVNNAHYGLVGILSLTIVIPVMIWTGPFDNQRPGFGEHLINVPEAALQFLDKQNIQGRIFNRFKWGGYILWRDAPARTVFTDPRGNIPADKLEYMNLALRSTVSLNELYQTYKMETVLSNYIISFDSDSSIEMKMPDPDWALVYWDDKALVYLRRDGSYSNAVDKYEYRHVNPAFGFAGLQTYLQNPILTKQAIIELKRNIETTSSINARLLLGMVYAFTSDFNSAQKLLIPLTHQRNSKSSVAWSWLGYVYQRQGKLSDAINAYQASLRIQHNPSSLLSLGISFYQQGDLDKATPYLEQTIEQSPKAMSAYQILIDIYQQQGNSSRVNDLRSKLDNLTNLKQSETTFRQGLDAYFAKKLDLAVEKFQASIQINSAEPAAYSNLAYVFYDKKDLNRALYYHQRALEIDPGYANSHFGAAQTYKKLNNISRARYHFKTYIKLVPNGYYTRRARNELKNLANAATTP